VHRALVRLTFSLGLATALAARPRPDRPHPCASASSAPSPGPLPTSAAHAARRAAGGRRDQRRGRLPGRPLELVVKDDQGNPDVGLQGESEALVGRRDRHHRLLQHRRGHEALDVSRRPGAADRALRHRHAGHLEVPGAAELHLPHLGARRHPGPVRGARPGQARLDQGRHLCRHHRLRRGGPERRGSRAGEQKPQAGVRGALRPGRERPEGRTAGRARRGRQRGVQLHRGPRKRTIANGKRDLGWDVPQVGAWPLSFPFFINGARKPPRAR
jgi:branched-chain amino acid transport system substrate-binding protein